MADAAVPFSTHSPDQDLVQSFLHGDPRAAELLYQRYADRLLHTIERYCSRETSSRFDAEDVVQSAFALFYTGLKELRYGVPEGGDLWNLLSVLAMNKLRDRIAHHRATKRSVFRTQELLDSDRPSCLSSIEATIHLRMVIDDYLANLAAPDRDVIRLRMLGHSVPDIAVQTGRAQRTIERLLQLCRDQLHELLELGDPE